MPLRRRDSEPEKHAIPTTQIDLDGTGAFALDDAAAFASLGFTTRKSTMKIRRNSARPILRNPF